MAKRVQYAFYCSYCDKTVDRYICADCGHKTHGYPRPADPEPRDV